MIVAESRDFEWIRSRTGCGVGPDFRAIAAKDGDRTLGMVGFDGWWGDLGKGGSVQMHVAIDVPIAARRLAPAAFDYAFNFAGKSIAIGVVPSHNKSALKFDLWLGFREVHRVRDGWAPGDDMVFLEMRRDECRWIRSDKWAK